MKTVYIPKGEIVRYESLMTEHLVVHGCLQVSNGIKARTITGQGTISAGTIDADVIRVDDVEAGSIVCKRLLAKRVQSPEVFASESATVSCFLSAAYVETGRLTVTLSEIDEVKAEEVVNLTPKKRTLFGTLLASLLRSFWIALTVHGQKEPTVMTDACEAMPEGVTESTQEETQEPEAEQAAPCEEENAVEPEAVDEELNRIVGIFKLAREQGYTLKLIPGTPEENAPAFDFENERILRPAAYHRRRQAARENDGRVLSGRQERDRRLSGKMRLPHQEQQPESCGHGPLGIEGAGFGGKETALRGGAAKRTVWAG